MMTKLKRKLQAFKNDCRGIGWILGVAFLSIVFMPFVYFPLSYAWDQLTDLILGTYTFTGTTASALIVVRFLLSYLLVFGLLITINWAIVQAKSRRYSP